MNKLSIVSVVGARPNFMKAAPVVRALARRKNVESLLVHTGQHYDERMSDVFFRDLGMNPPDVSLGVGSGSHASQTARVMTAFDTDVCDALNPDFVIVYGDVNSTVAAALVAKKRHIGLAHVEAGLRSGDRNMPEEINRVVVDAIADLLFVTEESGRRNLLSEGVAAHKVRFVGNTMIDSLARIVSELPDEPVKEPYLVVTLHRPSNVDNPTNLEQLLEAIDNGRGDRQIQFPVHPRTEKVLKDSGLYDNFASRDGWHLGNPIGYRQFVSLVRSSSGVVTDSGGIQEETTWLGVPCLTLRDSTERPSTIEVGTNVMVGTDPNEVSYAIARTVSGLATNGGASQGSIAGSVPQLWDGRAADRIAADVLAFISENRSVNNPNSKSANFVSGQIPG